MKSKVLFTVAICVGGIATVAFLMVYALSSCPVERRVVKSTLDKSDTISVATKASKPTVMDQNKQSKKTAKRRPRRVHLDEFDGLSESDRILAEALQTAMESDEHNKIITAAVEALSSTNADIRLNAVESLGWCGKDALTELTGLLVDSDDNVRDSAINNWECALAEVDNPEFRYKTALSVMGTITKSDALDSISGQFGVAAQEYIEEGDDEIQQNVRRTEVVQQLYGVINGSESICAEKAKEAYCDLTGYDWINGAEAEKYLANPDEYEPPEDR